MRCRGTQRARRGRVPGRRCLCPFPGPEGRPRKTFSPRFGAAALCCSGGGKPLSEPLALRHRGGPRAAPAFGGSPRVLLSRRFPWTGDQSRAVSRPGEQCPQPLWALRCGGSSRGDPALKVYRGARVFRILQRDRSSGMWWELLTSMLRKTKDFPFTGRAGGIKNKQTPDPAETNRRCSRRTKVSLWHPACRNVNETPP